MSFKKVQLLAAVSLLAVSAAAPAMAADMATKTYTKAPVLMAASIYDWSGLYIGLNAGGGSSHNCFSPSGVDFDLGCHNATGGTVGGQIGYRIQTGAWVFGVEGQGNWADFSGRHDPLAGTVAADLVTIGSKTDSFGLLTAQVGYAWGNALLYVKGGAAVVNNSFDISAGSDLQNLRRRFRDLTPGTVLATSDDTRWGGTIGAGVEYALSANWSLGVEYDHIFLGGRDLDINWTGGGTSAGAGHVSQDIDIGLVRLNYKFGGPVVAKY